MELNSLKNQRADRRDRRAFIESAIRPVVAASSLPFANCLSGLAVAAPRNTSLVIDTHMHVWSNDSVRYPFNHPYDKSFVTAPHEATVEMLMNDMDQHGCSHAVLVQVIYCGWDNRYIAECFQRFPNRLRAHGLIDPTDLGVADKLEFWMKEHGLHGMRFSPIYYVDGKLGGDSWLDADHTHKLWRKAGELGAIFNFFIAPKQLRRLAGMVRQYPDVRIVVDHLGRLDLKANEAQSDLEQLLALAKFPNVWVKVSELNSVSRTGQYPFEDTYPFVKRVYESFGPERLLFGTGFPGASRAAYSRPTLTQEIALIDKALPYLTPGERHNVLGGNAATLWGFAMPA